MFKRIFAIAFAIAGAISCMWGFGTMLGDSFVLTNQFSLDGTNGNMILLSIIIGVSALAWGLVGLSPKNNNDDESPGEADRGHSI